MCEKVSLIRLLTSLRELVSEELVSIHFQPIVELRNQLDRGLRGPGPGNS